MDKHSTMRRHGASIAMAITTLACASMVCASPALAWGTGGGGGAPKDLFRSNDPPASNPRPHIRHGGGMPNSGFGGGAPIGFFGGTPNSGYGGGSPLTGYGGGIPNPGYYGGGMPNSGYGGG